MHATGTDQSEPVNRTVLLSIACVIFVMTLATGVHRSVREHVLVYEAENAIRVLEVFEIQKHSDASSGRVLSIAQGKGRGWNHEAEGMAEYNIRMDKPGEYWLWLRSYWRSGCENAVYAQANNERKIVAGNDSVFNQWHWAKCGPLRFGIGNNKLFLLNHSDGIMIDKFELVQSNTYKPVGFGSEVKHFFDGFGGCDGNNSGSWTHLSGDWQTTGDSATNQDGRGAVLMQLSDKKAVTITEQIQLKAFHIQLAIQPGEAGVVGIVFGGKQLPMSYELMWHQSGLIAFTYRQMDKTIELGSAPRITGMWSYWDILYKDGALVLKVNNEPVGKPLRFKMDPCYFGLLTDACPFSSFDNVRIDCINE